MSLKNSFSNKASSSSISTSIESSIRDYRVENGRTYHSYKDGRESTHWRSTIAEILTLPEYAYPNDEVGLWIILSALLLTVFEAERDRLGIFPPENSSKLKADTVEDLMHHLYRLLLDDKLHLSPIKDDVQDVLDIGTGTGIWAIDFGPC